MKLVSILAVVVVLLGCGPHKPVVKLGIPHGIETRGSRWIFGHCEHEDDALGGRTICECPYPVVTQDCSIGPMAKKKCVDVVHCP